MDENLNVIVDKIIDLYISTRKKFVRQKPNGEYSHSDGFANRMFLGDKLIESHLLGRDTIGIFSPSNYTKFITFDVDAEDMSELARQEFVRLIIEELEDIGIERRYINVSLSGSKGYHISIFISDMTSKNLVEELYNYTVYSLGVNKSTIELRPSHKQAIKLPLGINRKTGNRCWFVDELFVPIENFDHVLKIEKINRSEFNDVVDNIKHKDNKFFDCVNNMYSEFKSTNPILTIEYVKRLEVEGLSEKGTRNYISMQLGILYNTLGYKESDALNKLNEWISKQPKDSYRTPINKCYVENRNIIKWVYSKDVKFTTKENDKITLYKKEIEWVSSVKNKKARHLLFAMLCHYKRYHNNSDEVFYMTYTQMINHSNISSRSTVQKYIKYLYDNGYIQIVRSNEYNKDTNKNLSNIYKLMFDDVYEVGRAIYTINDYTNYMANDKRLNDLNIL